MFLYNSLQIIRLSNVALIRISSAHTIYLDTSGNYSHLSLSLSWYFSHYPVVFCKGEKVFDDFGLCSTMVLHAVVVGSIFFYRTAVNGGTYVASLDTFSNNRPKQ